MFIDQFCYAMAFPRVNCCGGSILTISKLRSVVDRAESGLIARFGMVMDSSGRVVCHAFITMWRSIHDAKAGAPILWRGLLLLAPCRVCGVVARSARDLSVHRRGRSTVLAGAIFPPMFLGRGDVQMSQL